MSLIENMMTECIIMDKKRIPDGEGGFDVEWTEGATILAAITRDTTMNAMIAEAQGVKSVFTITTTRNIALDFHDVIKRKSDGRIFRVTTNVGEIIAPLASTLDIAQVLAESWELPS